MNLDECDLRECSSFKLSDSRRCENDDWNECDVGGVENPTLILNKTKISKLWDKIIAKRKNDEIEKDDVNYENEGE